MFALFVTVLVMAVLIENKKDEISNDVLIAGEHTTDESFLGKNLKD